MRLSNNKSSKIYKTQDQYLRDVMIKHNINEIIVLRTEILDEAMKMAGTKYHSHNNYPYRVTHSTSGKRIFEDIGIYVYPYLCYRGCRVYRLKAS